MVCASDCANAVALDAVTLAGSFSRPLVERFCIIEAMAELASVQFTVPLVVELTTYESITRSIVPGDITMPFGVFIAFTRSCTNHSTSCWLVSAGSTMKPFLIAATTIESIAAVCAAVLAEPLALVAGIASATALASATAASEACGDWTIFETDTPYALNCDMLM